MHSGVSSAQSAGSRCCWGTSLHACKGHAVQPWCSEFFGIRSKCASHRQWSFLYLTRHYRCEQPVPQDYIQITHMCNTCEHACSNYIRACECSKKCNNMGAVMFYTKKRRLLDIIALPLNAQLWSNWNNSRAHILLHILEHSHARI